MSCCGKKRAAYSTAASVSDPGLRARSSIRTASRDYFRYMGRTPIVVHGAVTGRRYRFDAHGYVVEVDPRDRPSLEAEPQLKRINSR
jgi:hypothetical protein